MKNFLLTPLFLIAIVSFGQWRVDFGVEAQVNQNRLQKYDLFDKYDPADVNLEVLDVDGDTLGIYFNKFSMANKL